MKTQLYTKEKEITLQEAVNTIRSWADGVTFSELRRHLQRKVDALNDRLVGKLVVSYHEDNPDTWRYGWYERDYQPATDEGYVVEKVLEKSTLIVKKLPSRRFQRADTYTAESVIWLWLVRPETAQERVSRKEAEMKARIHRQLQPPPPERRSTADNWLRFLPTLLRRDLPSIAEQIINKRRHDRTYLNTMLQPNNYNPEGLVAHFERKLKK